MWLVAFPLKSFKWPPLKKKALCSKFCNVKMKLPLKGIFWPSFRPKEPVLASQLPFKGIEVRGFFVDTAAMTVTWPARVSHKVCQAPPPCHGRPRRQIWLCAKQSGSANQTVIRQWLPWQRAGWGNTDCCSGQCVHKKAPPFDAFKWQLRGQYWFLWSETWSEYSFKWQLHFSRVRIGTIKPCISILFGSDLGQGGATERPRASPRSLWHFPLTLVWANKTRKLGDCSLNLD